MCECCDWDVKCDQTEVFYYAASVCHCVIVCGASLLLIAFDSFLQVLKLTVYEV